MSVLNLINDLCLNLVKSLINTDQVQENEIREITTRLKKKCFEILIKEKYKTGEAVKNISADLLIYQVCLLMNNDEYTAKKLKQCLSKINIEQNQQILKLLFYLRNKCISTVRTENNVRLHELTNTYNIYVKDYPIFNVSFALPTILPPIKSKWEKIEHSPFIDPKLLIFKNLNKLYINENVFEQPFIYHLTNNVSKKRPIISENNIWNILWSQGPEYWLKNVKQFCLEKPADQYKVYEIWKSFWREQLSTDDCILDIIDCYQFIRDCKNLLVGISSDSFIWLEQEQTYKVKTGLCIRGCLPDTLEKNCHSLIKSGILFKQLYLLNQSIDNRVKYGFIFKDLCFKLPEFFNFYRQYVLTRTSKLVLQFCLEIQEIHEIIEQVARCFCINIDEKNPGKVYKGINLLNHIYGEFLNATNTKCVFVVHYFLINCCEIYYRRFIAPWIFEGTISDPYGEFFINYNGSFAHYRNRKFWTNGYTVDTTANLPLFLNQYKDLILLCGKSIHFIKYCASKNDLSFSNSNSLMNLSICLERVEFDQLKSVCDSYVRENIGAPVTTIKELYKFEREKAFDLKQEAFTKQIETLQTIRDQRKKGKELVWSQKQQKIQEYHEERKTEQLVKDLLISNRIRQDLTELYREQELESQKTIMLELEKEKLRNYYATLNKELELKYKLVDNRTEQLKIFLNKNPLTLQLLKKDHFNIESQNNLESKTGSNPYLPENITTPMNHNSNMDYLLKNFTANTETFKTFDNMTTPVNNNQLAKSNLIEDQLSKTKLSNGDSNTDLIICPLNYNHNIINTSDDNQLNEVNSNFNESKTDIQTSTTISEQSIVETSKISNPYACDLHKYSNFSLPTDEVEKYQIKSVVTVNGDFDYLKIEYEKPEDGWKVVYGSDKTPEIEKREPPDSFVNQWGKYTFANCQQFDLNVAESMYLVLNAQSSLVSHHLMHYLVDECKILIQFRTLSNYFFFFETEYKYNFTSQLFQLLYTVNYPRELFNFKILYDIISYSIQSSNPKLATNEFKEKISLKLTEIPVVLDLQAADLLNCLCLTYQVEWPLNIILSESVLNKYNKIFQYLLKIRRVQWVLNDTFNILQFSRKEMSFDERLLTKSDHFKRLHLMRHTMNTWLTSLLCHVTEVVLHSSWFIFEENLTKIKTIDDIYRIHKQFVKDAVFRCSLNENSNFYIEKLNETFESIFKFHELFRNRQFILKNNAYVHPNYYKLQLCFNNFKEMTRYLIKLCEKQVRKGYQPHLEQFITVANFNNYFD